MVVVPPASSLAAVAWGADLPPRGRRYGRWRAHMRLATQDSSGSPLDGWEGRFYACAFAILALAARGTLLVEHSNGHPSRTGLRLRDWPRGGVFSARFDRCSSGQRTLGCRARVARLVGASAD